MGSGGTDYSKQINTALAQSNLPKSPLSQQYSNLFGSTAPGMMNALMNVQSLGNSFINSQSSPGSYQPQTANPGQNVLGAVVGPYSSGPQIPGTTIGNAWQGVFNSGNQGNLLPNNGLQLGSYGGSDPSGGSNYNPTSAGTNPNPYTGGFSYQYANAFPGVDPSQLPSNTSFNDLVKSGKITQAQVNQLQGQPANYDPLQDPNNIKQYNDWYAQAQTSPLYAQGTGNTIPNFNDWYGQYGFGATQIGAAENS